MQDHGVHGKVFNTLKFSSDRVTVSNEGKTRLNMRFATDVYKYSYNPDTGRISVIMNGAEALYLLEGNKITDHTGFVYTRKK